jgi:hypothetical protein
VLQVYNSGPYINEPSKNRYMNNPNETIDASMDITVMQSLNVTKGFGFKKNRPSMGQNESGDYNPVTTEENEE